MKKKGRGPSVVCRPAFYIWPHKSCFCMKKLTFLAAATLFSAALFAQNAIAPETTRLVEKYNLDKAQTARMDAVVAQKAKNLAAIEPLKTSNPEKYRAKLLNVLAGARASEGHVLSTKEQREIHQKMLVEIRTRRAEKQAELKKQKASKAVVEQAMIDIESEY